MWPGRWAGLSLLFSLSLLSSAWSQVAPTEASCCERLRMAETELKELRSLQATHGLTLNAGLILQLQQKKRISELEKSLEESLKELASAKESGDQLLKKIGKLETELTGASKSLAEAEGMVLGLDVEVHILWAADGIIGAGLVVYGIWKGDPIPVVAGGVMVTASVLHFTINFP